ncbi:hypothetical protein CNRVC190247_03696 [Vibrio cholerae]|nr:hypothetical protein V130003_36320 [Vibrio cholerae]CAH2567891.1 hypothetical protein CNRVC190247_03696 [Vibrio cholerae]
MAKKKYTSEFKRKVVLHYLNSSDGTKRTAAKFNIDHGAVRRWTEHWKASGEDGFTITTKRYTAEFKEEVLLWMMENNESSRKAAAKFKCSGQLKLATVLEFSQYNRSDSLGVKPPLY